MSPDDPRKARSRRRIAGERRPARADQPTRSEDDSPQPAAAAPTALAPEPPPEPEPVAPEPVALAPEPEHEEPEQEGTGSSARSGRLPSSLGDGPSWVVVAALGALALLLVVAAAVLGLGFWDLREVREQDQVDEAAREAPAAAERASAAILSYSYTSLDADERAAKRYMSPAYAKEYDDTFDRLVRPNAAKLKAKVEAEVKASGVAHADPHRVNVLLYVNQTTTSTANGGEPQLALNRVMLSMVERGGRWLVNDITSY
jgi:Mce-associated membrane protein